MPKDTPARVFSPLAAIAPDAVGEQLRLDVAGRTYTGMSRTSAGKAALRAPQVVAAPLHQLRSLLPQVDQASLQELYAEGTPLPSLEQLLAVLQVFAAPAAGADDSWLSQTGGLDMVLLPVGQAAPASTQEEQRLQRRRSDEEISPMTEEDALW